MLPRVLAGMFAVIMLAAVSCTISLILTYLAVHGFTLAGIPSYPDLVSALSALNRAEPAVDVIECGTILIIAEGLRAMKIGRAHV